MTKFYAIARLPSTDQSSKNSISLTASQWQPYYLNRHGTKKLCFSYGDLIGNGYWALMANEPDSAMSCDTACGVHMFAFADPISRCPVGLQIKGHKFSFWFYGQV